MIRDRSLFQYIQCLDIGVASVTSRFTSSSAEVKVFYCKTVWN